MEVTVHLVHYYSLLKASVNIVQILKLLAACLYMLSEYLVGCKNEPVKNILLQGYHMVFQIGLKNLENIKGIG